MASEPELRDLTGQVAARDSVVLRPSKRRKVFNLVLGLWAAFMAVAGGVAVAGGGVPGLIILIPALPLALYWLVAALPRSSSLTLTRRGFQARHLFIRRSWDWDDALGFGVRCIVYPRGGGITLVSFMARGGREPQGDLLQGLAIRGLTRTTTLPDAYGSPAEDLAAAMERCRARFADGAAQGASQEMSADIARSGAINSAALALVTAVMTAGSALLAFAGEDTASRVFGWVGLALFGVGGAVALVLRTRQRRVEQSARDDPVEVDATVEIARTASGSHLPEATVERVLDAHYAYLEKAPRDRPVDEREEGAWIASHTGLPERTVLAVLAAHLDFLRDAGIARDV